MQSRRLIGWVTLVLMLAVTPATQAQNDTELDGTKIDKDVYRTFVSNYRKYSRYAFETDAGIGVFPSYNRRYASSLGMTTTEAVKEFSETSEVRSGNLVRKVERQPPREDAEAYVKALPDTKIGSYGWVHSAQIVEVIDDNNMLIRELWLVDEEAVVKEYREDEENSARRNGGEADEEELKFNYKQRGVLINKQGEKKLGYSATHRLTGFDTRGLRVGDRWAGPRSEGIQIGVLKWESPDRDEEGGRKSLKRRLVMTEIEQSSREVVDEQGFKRLLQERDMTVADFVELMRVLREQDRRTADERIINALLPEDVLRKE